MVTGWLQVTGDAYRYYLDPASGAMTVGKRTIDRRIYYFNTTPAGSSGIPLGAFIKEEQEGGG